MKKLVELRKEIDPLVNKNVADAQERQKMQYDARHQQGSYKEGESVLVKNMKKVSKKGDKTEQNWLGPYEIAEHRRRKRGSSGGTCPHKAFRCPHKL